MSIYLKWAGAVVILLCSLFVSREYTAYVKRRLAQYRGFTAFASHVEGEISRFLTPRDSLWQNFSDDALEKCGFLPSLRSGRGLAEAFEACRAELSLSDGVKESLADFFSGFGADYMDGELSRSHDFCLRLESGLKAEEAELEKSMKITNALLLAGGAGLVILII